MKIATDVDGVIAAFRYIPWEDRAAYYLGCPPHPGFSSDILNRLAERHEVFVVSARSIPDAGPLTREWLKWVGVEVGRLAGVMCSISPTRKPELVELLGVELHIDDDPRSIVPLGPRGLLYYNSEIDGNSYTARTHPHVAWDWVDVEHRVEQRLREVERDREEEALTQARQLVLF